MRTLGFVGAVLVIVTAVIALFPRDDSSQTVIVNSIAPPTGAAAPGAISYASVLGTLSDGVQIDVFTEALGNPLKVERIGEHVRHTWVDTDVAIVAFTDALNQVTAYTITAMSPELDVLVTHVAGGIRLVKSTFADVAHTPQGMESLYPPNGQWSHSERFGGGAANGYKDVILAASWTSKAIDDPAATALIDDQCWGISVFAPLPDCAREELPSFRSDLHITSVTIGDSSALEAIGRDATMFFAEP